MQRAVSHLFKSSRKKVPLRLRFEELIFLTPLIKSYLCSKHSTRILFSVRSFQFKHSLSFMNQTAEIWGSPWWVQSINRHTSNTEGYQVNSANVEVIGPQTTHFPSARLTLLKMGYISGVGCPCWSSYRKTGERPTSSPNCCTPWSS